MERMLQKTIKESIIVLLIALILAAGVYALRPNALPLKRQEPTSLPANDNNTLYESITLIDAKELFNNGEALFVDARSFPEYEQNHIAGAIRLDPMDWEEWADRIISEYNPEHIIITYCHGVQCDLSRKLAERLTWLGFERVFYMIDGWGQWKDHGLPVE